MESWKEAQQVDLVCVEGQFDEKSILAIWLSFIKASECRHSSALPRLLLANS